MGSIKDSKEKRRLALRTVLGYLRRYRGGLALGGACLVVTDILLLVNPWILKVTIDELHGGLTRGQLARYAALLVLVTLLSGIFRFLMRRIMIGISRKIEVDIRSDFFSHLQTLSPAFYQRRRTGDLMALATNDLNAVRMLVGPGVMYSLNTLVVASSTTVLMLILSWKLTIAALLPMGILIFAVYRGMKVIHRLFEIVQQRFAAINSRAQENLSGIRVVKAYAREDYEIEEFQALSEEYVDRNMELYRVQSLLHPMLTAIAGLAVMSMLLVGGRLIIDGAITLGTFVAFSGYLTMLVWPMIAIGWVMNITERGLASMQRINEVMSVHPLITDPVFAENRAPVEDYSIRFENVSFSYNGGVEHRHLVLDNLSFEIANGETVAIVGPTGSGKSTLISLILRLYDTSRGQVLIGGRAVKEIPLHELRGLIGLVPQDIFLFSQTIRENIAFGVNDLQDPALRTVSETASIHDEIMDFPHGFESRVGERGINLSGGQKQRVAIARALLKGPAIMMFDEATSALDTKTEREIQKSLDEVSKDRTALVIAHRLSTVVGADEILVLEGGRIV
ncbi:MAG: ABC transporter ATP-binding protein, partial [Candidatus Krumholzibacteriota bacterium]|nr:ABC transporter ATP-binding protein [Candidatus Krumholzibacteriota bacterium]